MIFRQLLLTTVSVSSERKTLLVKVKFNTFAPIFTTLFKFNKNRYIVSTNTKSMKKALYIVLFALAES